MQKEAQPICRQYLFFVFYLFVCKEDYNTHDNQNNDGYKDRVTLNALTRHITPCLAKIA